MVAVGGDIHSFWVTDLKADFDDPSSATVATEFVGTSVTSASPPVEAIAAIEAGRTAGQSKMRSYEELNAALSRLGSAPITGATAAMAELPQMALPQAISRAGRCASPRARPSP